LLCKEQTFRIVLYVNIYQFINHVSIKKKMNRELKAVVRAASFLRTRWVIFRMKYLSLIVRVCSFLYLAGLAVTVQAEPRTKYVVPNQSPDATALAPLIGADADPVVVSVALAHELNGPGGRYCSPEVDIYNASGSILKVLVLKIDFFQKTAGGQRTFVGSTVTVAHNFPQRTTRRETFYVLDTANCNALSGVAVVQLCETSKGGDCTASIAFSEAGRVPLRPAPSTEGDRLLFTAPRQAPSASLPTAR
jgi:hypothetical protein